MSILVTGASGRVGAEVAKGLIAAGIEVRALSRTRPADAVTSAIRYFQGDLREPASLLPALESVSSVFLYAQGERPSELAQLLAGAGVQRVVLLSTIDATNQRPYAQYNRRRHLAFEQAISDAGLEFTFLRPGAFASNARRFWGDAISKEQAVPLPYPEAEQAPIDECDIARVALGALLSSDWIGQALVLTGPESLTQREQVQLLSQALDKPLAIRVEERKAAHARLAQAIPLPYVELLLAQWADEVGERATLSDAVERVTGRPPTRFADWAKRNVVFFQSVAGEP
ncbi:MAG TPA: NAD(P)H-binding protein [Polyangiaceae bacterium]|jgi:uncharacterized protein YbjT (DUF2867 family)|nr:NAD(P)H-binding protein [Polyangiaceae bacterium]